MGEAENNTGIKDMRNLYKEWREEQTAAFEGWDFSRLENRMVEEPLPWDYREIIRQYLKPNFKLLDMGTGGGEFLLALNHLYENSYVTEAYFPNINLCMERLAPLGISVKEIIDDNIPYDDEMFDIVLNRHESFKAMEIYRVLKPGGIFITQQVGEENNRNLSCLLCDDFAPQFSSHNLATNVSLLEGVGFYILGSGECFPSLRFTDVGAIVYFAKIIEWEFKGFSVDKCLNNLINLQSILEKQGFIESREHRFFIICEKKVQ